MSKTTERASLASRQRRDQEKEELSKEILLAATTLYLEVGYDKFSLRQVAERVGYTATTIYSYYTNKDDLLKSVIITWFSDFGTALYDAAQSTQEAIPKLNAIGKAYINWGLANPKQYRLIFMERADILQQIGLIPESDRKNDLGFGVLVQAVEEAVQSGALPPGKVETYSQALWVGVHGLVTLMNSQFLDPRTSAEVTDFVLHMMFKGLT